MPPLLKGPGPRAAARRRRGFTLIELVSVMAVIGILVAILIPVIGGAQNSAKRAKTRVQFSQWATAIEAFRQEYGYYPVFTGNRVNGNVDPDLALIHQFHDTLAGWRRDGAPLPPPNPAGDQTLPENQNRKRIRFLSFAQDEITGGMIVDAFSNTDIVVLVDDDINGIIPPPGGGAPQVQSASSGTFVSLDVGKFPPTGVRAGVIFYSAGDGSEAVTSW